VSRLARPHRSPEARSQNVDVDVMQKPVSLPCLFVMTASRMRLGGRRNEPRAIAAALNERGVPTPSGHGNWGSMQVARLLKRLEG
jgi:hypothetical protein